MLPNLIHPIVVWLRQIDRARTAVMDDVLKEPIGQARRKLKPIRLVAQMSIGDTDRPRQSEGGVVEESAGYLLFRTSDLRRAKITIDRGDRIVKIGDPPNQRDADLYILKLQWRGHYQDQGGPTLLKAFFEDRHPSRQRGDL